MEKPYITDCSQEALNALVPAVLEAFTACAAEYLQATGQMPVITSARRTLRHCAELMSAFTIPQLEGMYCKNGYPSYIRTIAETTARLGRKLTPNEVYNILCNRCEGYISAHLYGAAIDVSSDELVEPTLLERLMERHGFRVLNEVDLGIHCIHGTFKSIQPEIIKT